MEKRTITKERLLNAGFELMGNDLYFGKETKDELYLDVQFNEQGNSATAINLYACSLDGEPCIWAITDPHFLTEDRLNEVYHALTGQNLEFENAQPVCKELSKIAGEAEKEGLDSVSDKEPLKKGDVCEIIGHTSFYKGTGIHEFEIGSKVVVTEFEQDGIHECSSIYNKRNYYVHESDLKKVQ